MIDYMPVRLAVAVLALVLAAPAFAAKWRSMPTGSLLEFIVEFEGTESTGRFQSFDTELEFEPESGTASSLHVTVDVRSATMFSPDLDEAIAEATWFDSAAFPEARFDSNAVHQSGKREFLAQGKVAIKGVGRELNLPLNISVDGDRIELAGDVTLSRMDFGIGTGEWEGDSSIRHAVKVRFKVLMQKAN
jgi:polyisoprenoid-binding protein YceI